MKKDFAQADLSGWLSPDEERLLILYRDASAEERSEYLYRITRQRFVPWFAEHFDKQRDASDSSYLHEELEQQLRLICPRQILGPFWSEEPHCIALWSEAWGSIAPVILGPAERDGQQADALYNTALCLWDSVGDGPHRRQAMCFTRSKALAFIEAWREEVFALIFRAEP